MAVKVGPDDLQARQARAEARIVEAAVGWFRAVTLTERAEASVRLAAAVNRYLRAQRRESDARRL